MKAGAVYKYDLSIPVEKMYDLVDEMRIRMGKQAYNLFQLYMFGMEFSSQQGVKGIPVWQYYRDLACAFQGKLIYQSKINTCFKFQVRQPK